MFTDTHCHIYKEYYDDINKILEEAGNNGVNRIINNATNKSNIDELLNLSKNYDNMYLALGFHPEDVDKFSIKDLEYLESKLNNNKVVAIGEIGLDYYYTKDNKEQQIYYFEKQLELAVKHNLPVIVHSREATLDTINVLKKYNVKGVIHSFSGSYETAMIYIKMGFLLGINGVVTFKNCNLKDVYKKISLSNIILETDSPYLTPVPYRGKQNNPSHIIDIANFISELYDVSLNELADVTNANIKRIFDI